MKIDIIGSVASGKTTLAREISERYNVPYVEKDNIVWERTPVGDRKRTPEERDRRFNAILERDEWIVEGSPRDCLHESYGTCDYIIVLNEKTLIRLYRVFRRWLLQRIGKESYNSRPTLTFLSHNIKWVFEFNRIRKELLAELSQYENCRIFRNSHEAMHFIVRMYDEQVRKETRDGA